MYISQGHSICLVLRIMEVERSTYYAYVEHQKQPSAGVAVPCQDTPIRKTADE
ncbi:hypothetical protein [Paenibacillus sp. NPDC055715]